MNSLQPGERLAAVLEYEGYLGTVDFDEDEDRFHGRVINTRDVITFVGRSVRELRKAFRDSITDYRSMCEERGEAADKPFSGKLLLRLPPDLHRELAINAAREGKSLNAFIAQVLEARAAARV